MPIKRLTRQGDFSYVDKTIRKNLDNMITCHLKNGIINKLTLHSNFQSSPDVIQTIDVSALEDQTPQRPHWWDQFQLYRRTDLLRFSKQNDRRELWRTQKDFFLSCLGFMVGVGHTMRFPAKVYQHGGGVFFIPYLFSLIFFGLPLVFLHLSLGQYTGQAANTAFQRLMPIGSGKSDMSAKLINRKDIQELVGLWL